MYKPITFGVVGKPYNYIEYLCDEESDINSLPTNEGGKCAIGSKAIIMETKNVYILGNNNEWALFGNLNAKPLNDADIEKVAEIVLDNFPMAEGTGF